MIISRGFNDTTLRYKQYVSPFDTPSYQLFGENDEWVFGDVVETEVGGVSVFLNDSMVFDGTHPRQLLYWDDKDLSSIDGVVCFANYDSQDDELFVVGDYLGRAPLYYYFQKNLFGIRFLLAPALKCFYGLPIKDVHLLKMGECLRLCKNRLEVRSYTKISRIIYDGMEENIAIEATRRLLTDATKKIVYKFDHSKICAFLSGGVDSTVVTALTKQLIPNLTCYTFSVGDKGKADLYYARLVAERLNLDLREVVVTQEEVMEHIKEIIYLNEDSNWTQITSAVGQYFLARAAAQDGFKVAITGDMSDEIYASYPQIERWSWRDDQYVEARTKLINKGWINPNRSVKVLNRFGIIYMDPFSDREFLEFASNTPPQFKDGRLDGKRVNKYLLRLAFKDLIPTEIVTRAKGCQGRVTNVDEMFESDEKRKFILNVYNDLFNKDGKIVRVEE